MKFTGERMIPEVNKEEGVYLQHISRYSFASQFIRNKKVLDVASGSGYGSDLLKKNGADKVYGVDISKEAVEYSKKLYPQVEFIQSDAANLPFDKNFFDIVVSFETVEHLNAENQIKFIGEIKRVLSKNGMLIISTPNKKVFPEGNEFHVNELNCDEFIRLLKKEFNYIKLYYQDVIETNVIFSKESFEREGLDIINKKTILEKINLLKSDDSLFFIAVCSNEDHPLEINDYLTLSNVKPWLLYEMFSKSFKLKEKEVEEISHKFGDQLGIVKKLEADVNEKERLIEKMSASKFWKIRNRYLKLKNFFGL